MDMDIQVDGLVDLEKALKALPAVVSKRLINTATRAGASVISREARKLVPKRSGVLRKNIGVQRHKRQSRPHSVLYKVGWKGDGFYGRFLELGTRYQAARPHLRPALDANKREAINRIRVILWRGIVRESKKYNK